MLRSFSDLKGCSIHATDGELGAVKDVYFTDLSWAVRYVVVDTGHWLPGRRVLLSTVVLQQPDPTAPVLNAGSLTTGQVENAPGIEVVQPVSRQHEEALARHYRWPEYWGKRLAHGTQAALAAAHQADTATKHERGDPCLRSVAEVSGYHVEAADGEIGQVADCIIDTMDWEIRYLVIDTRNWWPGGRVLVSPRWIKSVNWVEQKVRTDMLRETIKSCPTYNPQELIDRSYEEQLHEALGQPKYWES